MRVICDAKITQCVCVYVTLTSQTKVHEQPSPNGNPQTVLTAYRTHTAPRSGHHGPTRIDTAQLMRRRCSRGSVGWRLSRLRRTSQLKRRSDVRVSIVTATNTWGRFAQ
jgi:hypothetical protein